MGYLLSVNEILDFAVFIEMNGYQFYVESLKKFQEPRIIELFQYLADEEFKHEKVFKKLLNDVGGLEPSKAYDAEYQAYMKEFCKTHALANRDAIRSKVEGIRTVQDAFDLALSFEKDSVVFFSELKAILGPDKSKPVERVIYEELNHIRKIVDLSRSFENR